MLLLKSHKLKVWALSAWNAVNDAECELYLKEEADQAKEQAESEHEVEYTSWYPEYNYDI